MNITCEIDGPRAEKPLLERIYELGDGKKAFTLKPLVFRHT